MPEAQPGIPHRRRVDRAGAADATETRIGRRVSILIAVGALIYANSFSAPFAFDDLSWIRHDRIGDFGSAIASLLETSRPVLLLSLALNYAVGGVDPTGYRVVNVVVHVLAALTLYGIARRTFRCRLLAERYAKSADSLAFAVALIWVAHPLATQAVTYVVQRAESLMALFYLLTLYCVIRSASTERHTRWWAAAIAFSALGMLTKEVMVGAPLVVLLYDRSFLAGSFAAALRSRRALYLGLAATWLLLLLSFDRGALSGGAAWAGFSLPELGALEYARSQPGVILHYLRLCFWPHPLVLDYGWPVADELGSILAATALVSALGLATVWALWRVPPLGFLGAFFFLVLAPTSSVLPIIDLAFEHRMYLPLVAVIATVVIAVNAALARASAPEWVRAALLVAIAVSLSSATVLRNREYRSAEVLWRTVVERAPDNARGQTSLGVALSQSNRHEEALVFLERAIELAPDYPRGRVNLAVTLIALGRFDDAEVQLRRTIEMLPTHVGALLNLGHLLQRRGEREAAIELLRAAVHYGPSDPNAHQNLANALLRAGRHEEALRHFRDAARLDPYAPKPLAGAAWILATHPDPKQRKPGEAARLAERALELSRSEDPAILSTVATACDAAGRPECAVRAAERALRRATELGATADAQRIRAQLDRYRGDAARAGPR